MNEGMHKTVAEHGGRWIGIVLASLALAEATPSPGAELTLGSPFGNGMVLQRDMPVPVWGWTEAGEKIAVEFKGQKKETIAGKDGQWRVTLDPLKADATPAVLLVRGAGGNLEVKDVLVGEVWICSGQSNMDMGLKAVLDANKHIDAAEFPKLRVLGIPVTAAALAQDRLAKAQAWRTCLPQTAGGFSAVAFFFGRDLLRKLDVPIGLIVVATGATPIELWVPREGLDVTPEMAQWAADARKADQDYRAALEAQRKAMAAAGAAATNKPADPVHPYMVKDNDRRGLGTFFNGSVAPLVGYALRGMIWYQGESNRGDSSLYYFNLHKALVNGWRKVWGQPSAPGSGVPWGEFPFYYVQISALESWRPGWHISEIWEGQTMVLQLPNTGMAVIHDLCEDIKQIHPKNKEGVGQRLALWALAKTYGVKDLPYAGPIYKSYTVEGKRIRIRFDYTFGGLKMRDGKPLDWFTIAGADGKFVPAQAEVDKDTIVVWSEQVELPTDVQFAWDGKAQPNLINGAGLPASPFRTNRGAIPPGQESKGGSK